MRYSTRLTLFALVSASACSDGAGPTWAFLSAVSGGGGTDTVLALPPQLLTIAVHDLHGPIQGERVQLLAQPDSIGPRRGVYVCSWRRPSCAAFFPGGYNVTFGVDDTTDAAGRVQARVQFGVVAGPARIRVLLPDRRDGDSISLHFTTRPGAQAQVIAAVPDTAIYTGTTYGLGGRSADRFGNVRPEPVTFTTSTPAVVSLTGDRVKAIGTGRGRIIMASGAFNDTAFVSVPPQGRLVTFGWAPDLSSLKLLTLVNTDGSNRRVLISTTANNGTALPVWSPSGGHIVYQEDGPIGRGELELIDTLGLHRPLLTSFNMSVHPAVSSSEGAVYFFGEETSSGVSGVYRASPTGNESQFVFSGAAPGPSPDGSAIAYVGGDSLFVRTLATATVISLAPSPGLPRWSPAGDLIAFISSDGSTAVRLVRPDGSQLRTVSQGFHDGTVTWSPDGQWLAVARWTGGIDLIRVADGETLPIRGTEDLFQPAWRP